MDKFCEDCIHNEVCQYGAIPPHKDRCNDKDTLDDLRPQGKWGEPFEHLGNTYHKCSYCCFGIKISDYDNFCPNCGAKMRKGGAE